MGQYHMIANLDKREFLHPHKADDGLKLMEFGQSAGGTLTCLTVLLAAHNGRGGGDIRTVDEEFVGRWAGDRIAIVGDYGTDEGDPLRWLYAYMGEDDAEGFRDGFPEGYQPDAEQIAACREAYGEPSEWQDITASIMAVLKAAGEARAALNR